MSIYQATLAALIAVAIWRGNPPWAVVVVMLGNFAASAAIGDTFELVAIVDLISAALLIGGGRREAAVAALFLTMAGAETIASRLQLPAGTIFASLEAMTALQCGVIGGADRGMGHLARAIRGHSPWAVSSARFRAAFRTLARNQKAHGGGLNGR